MQGDQIASQGSKAGDQVSSGRHGRQQEMLHGGRGLNVKIRSERLRSRRWEVISGNEQSN